MTVLLRKLTRKSVLDFGQYKDRSVQNMIDLFEYRYLRWVYFNASNITFFDDILDEINLPIDYRIPKPGVDRDAHKALNESKGTGQGKNWKHTAIGERIVRGKSTRKKYNRINREKIYFSKSSMRSRNQGH